MKELEELIPQMENLIQDKATLEDQVALLPTMVLTPTPPVPVTSSLLTISTSPLPHQTPHHNATLPYVLSAV